MFAIETEALPVARAGKCPDYFMEARMAKTLCLLLIMPDLGQRA
jgi:hypothetical protein